MGLTGFNLARRKKAQALQRQKETDVVKAEPVKQEEKATEQVVEKANETVEEVKETTATVRRSSNSRKK
jgi:hypothetical protein